MFFWLWRGASSNFGIIHHFIIPSIFHSSFFHCLYFNQLHEFHHVAVFLFSYIIFVVFQTF